MIDLNINPAEMNRDELREAAKSLEIPGRGRMSAADLRQAVTAELDRRKPAPAAPVTRELPARLRPRKPGRQATPMSNERREDIYRRQRNGGELTARQARRLR